jgi:hypothetical protein
MFNVLCSALRSASLAARRASDCLLGTEPDDEGISGEVCIHYEYSLTTNKRCRYVAPRRKLSSGDLAQVNGKLPSE